MNELRFGREDRVMVLVPHPDDESLAAGGLLQRAQALGAKVRVLFATDGENNPWTQRLVERRLIVGPEDRRRFGARRRAEAFAALDELGVAASDAVFLGFPDQGITDLLLSGDDRPLGTLQGEIVAFRPTMMVVPSAHDLHPDHSGLAILTRLAIARAARARADSRAEDPRVFSYLVHALGPRPAGRNILRLVLTDPEQERKRRAVLRHATQMAVHRGKFLAFSAQGETFYEGDAAAAAGALHPVRLVSRDGGSLGLELVLRPRPGAFGRTTLFVVSDAAGPGAALSLELDWKAGVVPIRRRASAASGGGAEPADGPVVEEARLQGRRRGGLVSLPLRALPAGASLFVKIERAHGFFDEAGWREIPASGDERAPSEAVSGSAGVCCVVPCYNVGALCGPVIREAMRHAAHVIAVDDGSTDDTGAILDALAVAAGGRLHVVRFPENRGKGTALLEAFRRALAGIPFDTLVTIDGDGQHRPDDIPRLVAACREGADLAMGERSLFWKMPLRSRIGNTLTSFLLSRLYTGSPTDTQSGFRGLERGFVERVVRLVKGRRYETELRILLLALAERRRIAIVPIPTLYFEGNKSSHFRPLADSLRIGAAILTWLWSARHTG